MSRTKLSSPCVFLLAGIVSAFLSSFAGAQSPNGQSETQERLLKYSKSPNDPLEIFNLKIGNQPIAFGEKFRAGDEWVKDLSFDVRNTSGRTITHFEFSVSMPSSKPQTPGGITPMFSHGSNTSHPDVPPTVRMAPDEAVHVTYSDENYKSFQSMRRSIELSVVTELSLRIDILMFDDDTAWSSAGLLRRNPSNPVAWVPFDEKAASPQPPDDPVLSLPLVDMAGAKIKFTQWRKEGKTVNTSLIDDTATATAVVKVTGQKDSPVQISLSEIFARNPLKPQINFRVKNIGKGNIRAIAIRYEDTTEKGAHSAPVFGDLFYPIAIMKPGQWESMAIGHPELTDPIKQISFSIDFVEFDDESTWGNISLQYTDWLAGRRAGMAAEREFLLQLYSTGGLQAVLREFEKTKYEPAVPAGHSPDWSEKFRIGAFTWRSYARQAHKVGGDPALAVALQKPLTDRPNFW